MPIAPLAAGQAVLSHHKGFPQGWKAGVPQGADCPLQADNELASWVFGSCDFWQQVPAAEHLSNTESCSADKGGFPACRRRAAAYSPDRV